MCMLWAQVTPADFAVAELGSSKLDLLVTMVAVDCKLTLSLVALGQMVDPVHRVTVRANHWLHLGLALRRVAWLHWLGIAHWWLCSGIAHLLLVGVELLSRRVHGRLLLHVWVGWLSSVVVDSDDVGGGLHLLFEVLFSALLVCLAALP